jgi:hypothetical protein
MSPTYLPIKLQAPQPTYNISTCLPICVHITNLPITYLLIHLLPTELDVINIHVFTYIPITNLSRIS